MEKLEFERMEARFDGILLHVGLRVDSFTLSSDAATVSWPPFALTADGAARARVEVSEGSVAKFLDAKTPASLQAFKVKCTGGKVVCEASVKMVVEISAKATCTLRIEGGRQVYVDVESVDVMGGPAKKLIEAQLAKINPILDASEFPMRVDLDSVTVDKGSIVVTGTVRP
ncbi:MAG: LmeA family phospholipid-binding protein [Fimbriimonadaceae bacterium]|nr:LmeA family phospholipid-binding protein [Fimbriimonadaceae bacterium]